MTTQLSHNEKQAFIHLHSVSPRTHYGIAIHEILKQPSQDRIRGLFSELVSQLRDDPPQMLKLLGFDLLKTLNMKIYEPQDLNRAISSMGYAYRVTEEIRWTSDAALWVSPAGYFTLPEAAGTVYVDSDLSRFIRLSNGQIFACSSTDLSSLSDLDKINFRAYLTGLID